MSAPTTAGNVISSGRPFRFATSLSFTTSRAAIVERARAAEALGYSTVGTGDHFMLPFAPLVALQAAADATTTLRLTPLVLNQDLRHPAALAKELATLDVLSGGRLEVGIGAGWMRAEYEQAGITFAPASTRIPRLEEQVLILKGLFADGAFDFAGEHFTISGLEGLPKPVQRPGPPIMIAGGGRKLLSVAGRQADVVQIAPPLAGGVVSVDPRRQAAEAYEERIAWIRDAAGARFAEIELGALLANVTITDDADAGLDAFVRSYAELANRVGGTVDPADVPRDALMASPVVAIGTIDEVVQSFRDVRARFGISYFLSPVGASPESLAPIVERLSGR